MRAAPLRDVNDLFRAVGAVAGVTKARQDEAVFIQSFVDRGKPDWNVGMDPAHPFTFISNLSLNLVVALIMGKVNARVTRAPR